jgi:endonuclease/exonuclease/phosphatase family metal-dependent hydrolase
VDKQIDVVNGNGWAKRFPVICQQIRYHDFDIFGAQEVESHQLKDMQENLPGYTYIGVAREDGKDKGEFVPVFYKHEMFDLLTSGYFWLSPEPDIPTKGWDAECYRIVTYGQFSVKKDGFRFWFFNTHFDHRGVSARKESAGLILNKIKELTKPGDYVIVTGDFNSDQDSEVYSRLKNSDAIRDAYDMAAFRYARHGTANNFEYDIATDSRFDHILLSPSFHVLKYAILTDTYQDVADERKITLPNFPKEIVFTKAMIRFPSDHYPVSIQVDY